MMDIVKSPAVTSTDTRQTRVLVDGCCQTDPVIILPMPPDVTPPSPQPFSISTHAEPITPIYRSRSRRKKHPIKLNHQELQASQEFDEDDADPLYVPKTQIPASKHPYYKLNNNVPQSAADETWHSIPNPPSPSPPSTPNYKLENAYPSSTAGLENADGDSERGSERGSERRVPSKQAVSVIKSVEEDSARVGRFKCLLCPYANNHKIALELHSIVHDSQPPYACRKCAFSSSDVVAFNVHVRHHTGEQKFTCYHPGCDYTSNNSSNLKRHCRSHKLTKPYRQNSNSARTASNHAASFVLSDDSSGDTVTSATKHSVHAFSHKTTSVLKIPKPGVSSKPASTVLNQLADVVNGISSKGLPTIAKEMRSHKVPASNTLQCEQCEYHTTNPTNLRRHKVKHRLHRSHKCTNCNYATNYLGNMRRHFEVRHKGIPFDKTSSFSHRMGGDKPADDISALSSSCEGSLVITKSKRPLAAAADVGEMDRKRVKYSGTTEARSSSRNAEHSSSSVPKINSSKRDSANQKTSSKRDSTNQKTSSKRECTNQISSLALLQQMVLQNY